MRTSSLPILIIKRTENQKAQGRLKGNKRQNESDLGLFSDHTQSWSLDQFFKEETDLRDNPSNAAAEISQNAANHPAVQELPEESKVPSFSRLESKKHVNGRPDINTRESRRLTPVRRNKAVLPKRKLRPNRSEPKKAEEE